MPKIRASFLHPFSYPLLGEGGPIVGFCPVSRKPLQPPFPNLCLGGFGGVVQGEGEGTMYENRGLEMQKQNKPTVASFDCKRGDYRLTKIRPVM